MVYCDVLFVIRHASVCQTVNRIREWLSLLFQFSTFLELASFRNVHNLIVVIIFFEIFRQKEFVSFSSLCRVELGPDGHFCPGRLVFIEERMLYTGRIVKEYYSGIIHSRSNKPNFGITSVILKLGHLHFVECDMLVVDVFVSDVPTWPPSDIRWTRSE